MKAPSSRLGLPPGVVSVPPHAHGSLRRETLERVPPSPEGMVFTMTKVPTPLEHTEEGRAFLQQRVSKYGIWGSGFGWLFLAQRLIGITVDQRWDELTDPSFVFHFLGAATLLALGLACMRGTPSVGFIRGAEVLGMLASSTFYALMGLWMWPFSSPHYIILLALAFGLIVRAIYVPSSFRWSLLVTALPGIPLLVVTYLLYAKTDFSPLVESAAAFYGRETPEQVRENLVSSDIAAGITVFTGTWWLCVLAICGSASRVIYGLRTKVREVTRLGQYTLLEKLGEGGMGAVYRARHAMLRRPTALKLLKTERAGAEAIARFEKEVQLTAALTHPNTVTIFDYGRTPEGVFYYVMELLDGATVTDIVEATGAQPPARVVHILRDAASALAEAHGVNLIHRDIKPSNIMLVEQGGKPDVGKVLDFGLVKELEGAEDVALTQANSITGTPQYLSPEGIVAPDTVDARSDIYALGAVGYYLLTGSHLFDGNTVVEVCGAHLHKTPEPLSERLGGEVPPDLEALILKCLSKMPEERPQSAEELERALDACEVDGEWTVEQARNWWQRHREALDEARERHYVTGSSQTVAVDFGSRKGAA